MTVLSRNHLFAAAALGAAALVAAPAVAQELLDIKVKVANSCAVTGQAIDFGTYYRGQSADLPAEGALNLVGCPAGTIIVLGDGQFGGNGSRQLSAGGNFLPYRLYKDPAFSDEWQSAGLTLAEDVMNGSIPVYGVIAGGEDVSADEDYIDSVQINVTF